MDDEILGRIQVLIFLCMVISAVAMIWISFDRHRRATLIESLPNHRPLLLAGDDVARAASSEKSESSEMPVEQQADNFEQTRPRLSPSQKRFLPPSLTGYNADIATSQVELGRAAQRLHAEIQRASDDEDGDATSKKTETTPSSGVGSGTKSAEKPKTDAFAGIFGQNSTKL